MIFADEADKVLVNHPIIHLIEQHIIHNFPVYIGLFATFSIATIMTMPVLYPKTFQDFWTWARNALQTSVPANRQHPGQTIVVKDEEEPPK